MSQIPTDSVLAFAIYFYFHLNPHPPNLIIVLIVAKLTGMSPPLIRVLFRQALLSVHILHDMLTSSIEQYPLINRGTIKAVQWTLPVVSWPVWHFGRLTRIGALWPLVIVYTMCIDLIYWPLDKQCPTLPPYLTISLFTVWHLEEILLTPKSVTLYCPQSPVSLIVWEDPMPVQQRGNTMLWLPPQLVRSCLGSTPTYLVYGRLV